MTIFRLLVISSPENEAVAMKIKGRGFPLAHVYDSKQILPENIFQLPEIKPIEPELELQDVLAPPPLEFSSASASISRLAAPPPEFGFVSPAPPPSAMQSSLAPVLQSSPMLSRSEGTKFAVSSPLSVSSEKMRSESKMRSASRKSDIEPVYVISIFFCSSNPFAG